MNIPEAYYNQAVKPRGSTVNERLSYLLNWYVNTGTKVAQDSNWEFQIETNKVMAQFGGTLRPLLLRDRLRAEARAAARHPLAPARGPASRRRGDRREFGARAVHAGPAPRRRDRSLRDPLPRGEHERSWRHVRGDVSRDAQRGSRRSADHAQHQRHLRERPQPDRERNDRITLRHEPRRRWQRLHPRADEF